MTLEIDKDAARQTRAGDSPGEPAEPPSTFLVTRAPTSEIGQDTCTDVLTLQPPSTANLLVVAHERSPDEWLDTWRRRIGEAPANRAIVTVGSTMRSAAQSTPGSAGVPSGHQEVLSVTDPGDLTRLGIVVNECVGEWRDNDHRTVVCGGSLTAMLQWVELPVLFRFLHVFVQRLRAADALVHFHLHPEVHPDRTRRTLEPLFDRVIDEPLNRSVRDEPAALDTDVVRELVADPRRRHVLRSLLETESESMALRDLAGEVAAREHAEPPAEVSDITRERTSITLHHNHLAKLDATGLVGYDRADHTVQLVADESLVMSYLDNVDESK